MLQFMGPQRVRAREAHPGHTSGLPAALPPAAGFQEAEAVWLSPVLED